MTVAADILQAGSIEPNAAGLFGVPHSVLQRRFQWELRSKGWQRIFPKDQSQILLSKTLNLCAQ